MLCRSVTSAIPRASATDLSVGSSPMFMSFAARYTAAAATLNGSLPVGALGRHLGQAKPTRDGAQSIQRLHEILIHTPICPVPLIPAPRAVHHSADISAERDPARVPILVSYYLHPGAWRCGAVNISLGPSLGDPRRDIEPERAVFH
jgi:hypothetical protein